MTDMTDMTSIDCDTTSLNAIALRGNPLKWSTFYKGTRDVFRIWLCQLGSVPYNIYDNGW